MGCSGMEDRLAGGIGAGGGGAGGGLGWPQRSNTCAATKPTATAAPNAIHGGCSTCLDTLNVSVTDSTVSDTVSTTPLTPSTVELTASVAPETVSRTWLS